MNVRSFFVKMPYQGKVMAGVVLDETSETGKKDWVGLESKKVV